MKVTISVGEILYYLFWITMLAAKGLGLYEGMLIYNICLLFSFGCILLKIVLERHSVCEWIVILSFLMLGGIIYLSSQEKAPLIYIMMVIGMKNIPVKRVFQIGLPVWLFCFIWMAFSEVTGLTTGYVFVHEKLGLGPILRWSFGYPHPNVMQISYAVLTAFILYLSNRTGKKQLELIGWLFVGNCYVFLYSISYTGVILTTLCLLIFYYFVNRRSISKIEQIATKCVLPFCVLFSIFGPLLTEKGMILENLDPLFDKLLNTRFLASRLYLSRGVTLFGSTPEQLNISFALDSSFVSLLIRDGVIFFILILMGYWSLINYYIKTKRNKEVAIILSFLIAGISEPFLFNTSFKNLSFIFMGEFFFYILANIPEDSVFSIKLGTDIMARKIIFSIGSLGNVGAAIRGILVGKKKNIVLIGIVVGIIFSIMYKKYALVPDSIFVDKGYTDTSIQEEKYMDINQLPENFHSIIYDYQGDDSPMYEFTGNIIILETFRGLISWALIGWGFGCSIVCVVLVGRYYLRKRHI